METDAYTKAVLTVVAVCLLLLVAQGFGLGPELGAKAGSGSAEIADSSSAGKRFEFLPIPMARAAFRMDNQTGETWWMKFPGGRAWVPIDEGGEAEEMPEPAANPPVRRGPREAEPRQGGSPAPPAAPSKPAE
jgi:hypothetical protein